MKSSTVVLALAASANAAIIARDVPTVLADLDAINSQTQSLATAVNAFNDINDAAGLIAAEGELETAIKQATTDASATTGITDAEGASVLDAVRGLIPNIVTSLNAVVSKSEAFSGAGVETVVAGNLATLQGLSGDLAAALIANAPEGAIAGGNAAASCIDAAFVAAQATQSADDSCAASVTFAGGAEPTPSASATEGPSSSAAEPTGSASSSAAEPTGSATGVPAPYPTASTTSTPVVKPTGGAYPTYTPIVTNNAQSVKVGLTGVVALAVFALFM